ncbi:hypothetical protein [Nocardia barduliensis]|nr:hypothetical protein [Nocardia barduliensis]
MIEDVKMPRTDEEDRDRIIWPESSKMSAWWADVMGHRFPRTQTVTSG